MMLTNHVPSHGGRSTDGTLAIHPPSLLPPAVGVGIGIGGMRRPPLSVILYQIQEHHVLLGSLDEGMAEEILGRRTLAIWTEQRGGGTVVSDRIG